MVFKCGHLALRISFWPLQLAQPLTSNWPWEKGLHFLCLVFDFSNRTVVMVPFFPLTRLLKVWSDIFLNNQHNSLAIFSYLFCFDFCLFFVFLVHGVTAMWHFLPRASPNGFLPQPPDTWNSTVRNLFIWCQHTVLWERIGNNTSQPFLP